MHSSLRDALIHASLSFPCSTEVEERDKPNPTALGQILRVGNQYSYHDLDDLIVSHIGEIVSKGDQLMRSDKFKGRNVEDLRT